MEFEKRTDLAIEKAPLNTLDISNDDYELLHFSSYGIDCIRVTIKTENGEKLCKRKKGIYTTIICGNVWQYEKQIWKNVRKALCDEILFLMNESKPIEYSFLVAGLGNRFITSDSLGPICVDKMGFNKLNPSSTFLISPGVMAQSGIESKALIKTALQATSARFLILIDSLCSSSLDRLCTTIQISNTGLAPGSGTSEARSNIGEDLNVPIISIGVPTVVNLSSIIFDTIKELKLEKVPHCVDNSLKAYSDLFVSPKEIDAVISSTSSLISQALEMAIKVKNPLQK